MAFDYKKEYKVCNLPNIVSASRGIAAIAMLFFPVFNTPFWILYCWGGVSDMIDGLIARKTNTASELGSRIDSIADLLFLVCSAIMVFPVISLPIWIWIWVAAIGVVKATCILIRFFHRQSQEISHSVTNKHNKAEFEPAHSGESDTRPIILKHVFHNY